MSFGRLMTFGQCTSVVCEILCRPVAIVCLLVFFNGLDVFSQSWHHDFGVWLGKLICKLYYPTKGAAAWVLMPKSLARG